MRLRGKDPKAAMPRSDFGGYMRKKPMTTDALTCCPPRFRLGSGGRPGRIK
jgi:hypothetical protein